MGQSVNFVQRSPCLEADSTLAGKEIDRFLWYLKCQYLPLTQAVQEESNIMHTVKKKES
jgi:hypothetical protein